MYSYAHCVPSIRAPSERTLQSGDRGSQMLVIVQFAVQLGGRHVMAQGVEVATRAELR